MKINEISIGDQLYKKIGVLNEIFPFKVDEIINEEFCGYEILDQYGLARSITEVYPIPLTEDILKANGFILQAEAGRMHHKIYGMPTDYRHSLEDAEKKGGFYWRSNNALICLLRYVHQLQHALRLCGFNELADNFKIE